MDIDIDQDQQDDDAPQATLSAAAMAAGQAAQMAITATTITSSNGLTMRRKPSVGDVIGPFQETEVGAGATGTTSTTGSMNMIDLPPDLHGGGGPLLEALPALYRKPQFWRRAHG